MSFRSKDFKSFVYTIPPFGQKIIKLRHGWELNPRIRVLQTLALPLGYRAIKPHAFKITLTYF